MSPDSLKKILESHRAWLRREAGERADLRDGYLMNADLAHVRLTDAVLVGVDLRNSNLHNADLSNADLCNADLREANLSDANLKEANLEGANLSGADLSNITLTNANLQRTTGVIWADCGWADHGMHGRRLLAVRINDEDVYFCGCFQGSLNDLLAYIADIRPDLAHSRTLAANFCAARMREMRRKQ